MMVQTKDEMREAQGYCIFQNEYIHFAIQTGMIVAMDNVAMILTYHG